MSKLLEPSDSGLRKAVCTDGKTGEKAVIFKTEMVDFPANIIGLHVIADDGVVVNKSIEDDHTEYGFGNAVATTMDALMNTVFPVGTEFEVTIKYKLPED